MPAVASLPEKLIVSGWLYQPLLSAARLAFAVAVGAVASYLKGRLAVAMLPALSVQVPLTVALSLSVLQPTGAEQALRPAVASLPAKLTVSGWLYQPFVSAARLAAAVAVGAVASYLSGRLAVATLPALSVQEPLTVALGLSGLL